MLSTGAQNEVIHTMSETKLGAGRQIVWQKHEQTVEKHCNPCDKKAKSELTEEQLLNQMDHLWSFAIEVSLKLRFKGVCNLCAILQFCNSGALSESESQVETVVCIF